MALGVGVAAEQAEQVRAERAAGRPRLLAVEEPAAVDAPCSGADRREVAARTGFRPALAPQVLCGGHAREDVVLLCLRAELEQRRREQEDAVLRDPLRSARPVVLLLEQQPLPQRRAAAAVLDRPRHGGPPVGEEHPLPVEVLREALPGVAGVDLVGAAVHRPPLGQMGLEPRSRLGPERLVLVAPGQVHSGRAG